MSFSGLWIIMNLVYELNIRDLGFGLVGLIISSGISYRIYQLSTSLGNNQKFEKEERISEKMESLGSYKSIILTDVKKYKLWNYDSKNNDYRKQGAEFYRVLPNFGLEVILTSHDIIRTGLIPFDRIEYIRDYDGEDSKPIIICKFKGLKYYKSFRSPFKEMRKVRLNKNYKEGDPLVFKYTSI